MANIGKRVAGAYQKAKDGLMEYAYLVTLGAVIAIVAAAAMYTDQIKTQQAQEIAAAAQAAEIAATATPKITPLPTIAPLASVRSVYPTYAACVRPVSGEIIRGYSDKPVRWTALGAIQAHEAVDIAGEKDESVFSVLDGVVTEAAMDALWGWRVSIAHTDGSEGVYAGMNVAFVRAGESVSRGQEIGVLMDAIPCERELGSHLHFEWAKAGVKRDPQGILTR